MYILKGTSNGLGAGPPGFRPATGVTERFGSSSMTISTFWDSIQTLFMHPWNKNICLNVCHGLVLTWSQFWSNTLKQMSLDQLRKNPLFRVLGAITEFAILLRYPNPSFFRPGEEYVKYLPRDPLDFNWTNALKYLQALRNRPLSLQEFRFLFSYFPAARDLQESPPEVWQSLYKYFNNIRQYLRNPNDPTVNARDVDIATNLMYDSYTQDLKLLQLFREQQENRSAVNVRTARRQTTRLQYLEGLEPPKLENTLYPEMLQDSYNVKTLLLGFRSQEPVVPTFVPSVQETVTSPALQDLQVNESIRDTSRSIETLKDINLRLQQTLES